MSQIPDNAPYRDPHRPVDARVEDLVGRMTLEEKVAQLGSAWAFQVATDGEFDPAKAEALLARGIGHLSRAAGATGGDARTVARLTNAVQRYLLTRTRLGIPALVHEECCAGLMARGATVFPQIIGLASTWQPELAEAMTAAIRRQMRSIGARQGLAPVLDVARDPRWGRIEETFGEDPYLVGVMGTAYVRGLQGPGRSGGVVATGKHFAAYGVPEGGMNWAPAHVGRRELLEVFLAPFEMAVREARLGSVMNGYHELDGIPAAAHRELLTDILREQWGFDGIVVSDYGAVGYLVTHHRIAVDRVEAAREALYAGIDVELPATECFGQALVEAVRAGRVEAALLDAAVRRVLRMKFELGLFENPYVDEEAAPASFDTLQDRALAREIAARSMVLLKNDGGLLPLDPGIDSIAVIGPAAHSYRLLNGDYHYPAHVDVYTALGASLPGGAAASQQEIAARELPAEVEARLYRERLVPFVSILDGIRASVSPETRVLYARGCGVTDRSTEGFAQAVEAARHARVAVVAVGEKSGLTRECTCGEFRDRATLGLPGVQEELVQAVLATGTPTVVVLVSGRPLALSELARRVPAMLAAWIPGEEGGHAVADVLFGRVNPAGRLPVSIPRGVGQVPLFYAHKPTGGRSHVLGDYVDMEAGPLFPFGHGLSYTTFEYRNLSVQPEVVGPDGEVSVTVQVTNSGRRAGDEVVQLYVRDVLASVTRPVKELRGFKRLTLQPGQSRTVRFRLKPAQMAFYDRQMQLVVEPGEFEVMVGASSHDIRLTGRFRVAGETTTVSCRNLITPVEVD